MRSLSLQARLLAGVAVMAVMLAGVAAAVLLVTGNVLVSRIDDQLRITTAPGGPRDHVERDGNRGSDPGSTERPADYPERLSPLFEAVITPEGELEILFRSNLPGRDYSNPQLDVDTLRARLGETFTVDAVDGDVRYRVLAVTGPTSSSASLIIVRALPLVDVDTAMNRLLLLQALAAGAVLAVLAAVTLWTIRLGIRPITAMTATAGAIAAGDLSVRVPEPSAAGTEAGALARTLNGMLGRIEAAIEDQRRSDQRLRRFVADASHELRTPLTTIQGYAELYRHGALADRSALDDAMRRTEEEARRMGRLVEDLLTLAKLDQERPQARDRLDLALLTSDAVADVRAGAPRHQVRSSIEEHLVVVGDEDRLRQVLANVITNAVVHTPPGTAIEVVGRRSAHRVEVAVSDDGPGMPADVAARITERFYRADPSRSRERGGSGLGLAIVEAVVTAHGGTLTVDSAPGRGTTVTLSFPAAAAGPDGGAIPEVGAHSEPGVH